MIRPSRARPSGLAIPVLLFDFDIRMSIRICLDIMRTTVRLDAALMTKAKAEATRRGETLTALIERWLRLVLAGAVCKTVDNPDGLRSER